MATSLHRGELARLVDAAYEHTAAEQRIASGLRGNLGEHRTMLSLATQVLSERGTR